MPMGWDVNEGGTTEPLRPLDEAAFAFGKEIMQREGS